MGTQQVIDRLKSAAQAQNSVVGSVLALAAGFVQAARDAKDDPEELEEVLTQFESNTASLAQAVAVNTPAAPEVPESEGGTGSPDTIVDPETVEIAEAPSIGTAEE